MSPTIMSRQVFITEDDRGPVANLGAWITMTSMILVVITKLLTKLSALGRWQRDDLLVLLVMVLAIVQTIVTSLEVSEGLGTHTEIVQDSDTLQKLVYGAQVLYIITLSLAQISLIQFEFLISRPSRRQQALKVVVYLIGLWTFASFFAVVFQCGAPMTWAIFGDKCFNQSTFWTVWTVFNVAIDVFVSFFPIALLHDVRFPLRKKINISGAFVTRIGAIPIVILRAIYISKASGSSDRSFTELDVSLLTVIHMNVTIILTCIPFLKPVLDSLQTGIWIGGTLAEGTRHGTHGSTQERSGNSNGKAKGGSKWKSPVATVGHELRSLPGRFNGREAVSNEHNAQVDISRADYDRMSDDSHKPMTINQTTTIVVESERNHF